MLAFGKMFIAMFLSGTPEEIEESIMMNSGIVRNREINASEKTDEML